MKKLLVAMLLGTMVITCVGCGTTTANGDVIEGSGFHVESGDKYDTGNVGPINNEENPSSFEIGTDNKYDTGNVGPINTEELPPSLNDGTDGKYDTGNVY